MIKVITIDFWNTLFDSSNGTKRNAQRQHVLFEEIAKFGIDVSNSDYEKALKASWEFFNNIWMNEQRTPMTEETIVFFWNYLNLPYDNQGIQKVANVFKESIIDYPPQLIDGCKEFLSQFHSKFKIGLISDTGFTPGSILKKLMELNNIEQYFSAYSFSDETGVSKPHAKAFSTILEQFEIIPQEAIHIGDIEKTDIIGAKSFGMKAIRFEGDKTGNFIKNNPQNTIADFTADSWSNITEIINSFNF